MSISSDFIRQSNDFPLQFEEYIPDPIPYGDQKYIITSVNGIFIYSINNNSLTQINNDNDPDNPCYQFVNHGHFLDHKRNILYIFGGQDEQFFRYCLNSNQFESFDDHPLYDALKKSGIEIRCIYAPKRNEIHFFGGGPLAPITVTNWVGGFGTYHCVFDIEEQAIIDLSPHVGFIPFRPQTVHGSFTDSIMSFGSYQSQTIHQYSMDEKKWSQVKGLKMPCDLENDDGRFCSFVYVDDIIIAVYKKEPYCIWILDLWTNQWFKSDSVFPHGVERESCLIMEKFMLHVIDFHTKFRYKIDILQLIPDKMKKIKESNSKSLVWGYIKEREEQFDYNVPFALKYLIFKYLFLF